jgi:hypothetical protein
MGSLHPRGFASSYLSVFVSASRERRVFLRIPSRYSYVTIYLPTTSASALHVIAQVSLYQYESLACNTTAWPGPLSLSLRCVFV